MKTHAVLARLLELRRLAERRALEALIARDEDCRRAQQALEAAQAATRRQLATTHAQERKEIEAFRGEVVSQSAFGRFHAKLDTMMIEYARLRTLEETERKTLQEGLEARAHARQDFRARQRTTIKLDEIVKRQSMSTAYRQATLAEVAEEEPVNDRPTWRTADGH